MRRIRFVPALLVFLLSACNERLIDTQLSKEKGEVVIDLTADERVDIVSVKSGTDSELPDVSEFRIELVNSENVKFYRETYSPETVINLNAGEYTLMAKHGDSLGFGFNAPFYMAKQTFTVEPQKKNVVKAVAKLANVKVAVNYGDQIKADYTDFYTVVHNLKYENAFLKFNDDETRAGYIPGGKLGVKVYATVDGALKAFTLKDNEGNPAEIEVNPNDFITFNVNTGISYGGLVFTILIDNGTELVEKEYEISYDASDDAQIVLSSFDDEGNYYVTEGLSEEADNVSFTYKAPAGVKSCVLDVDCEYMESLGIPTSIDVTSLDADQLAELEAKGFFFAESGLLNVGVIDISDFISDMSQNAVYNGPNTILGEFTLTLTDALNVEVKKTARVLVKPNVTATLSIEDYDVWATKLADATVSLTGGQTSLTTVQYSKDGKEWYDAKTLTLRNGNIGAIDGLEPSTEYQLRLCYDGWCQISDVVSFTTEAAAQLGNSGFEDWTTKQWEFEHNGNLGGQASPMNYYKPWATGATDIWWDSNTTNSLRSSLTIGYTFFKTYPLVHYSTDAHSGNKAAQLTVANVGNTNSTWATTGDWYVGELFLGKGNDGSDGGWSKTTDGHAFSSRPTSLTFWYEYAPYSSSDYFTVNVEVIAQDGSVLAAASSTGTSASEWKSITLPLNYTVTDKKASTICISYKASGSSSHSCDLGGHWLEIAGSTGDGDKYRIKLSATLRVDDLTLNY